MCVIAPLTIVPCGSNAPGVKGVGYMCPAEEFAADLPFLATTGSGDTVKLNGTYSFTGAGTGFGYFRKFTILQNTGNLKHAAVGPIGSKSIETSFAFQIAGTDAPQLEWFRNQLNIPGVWLCPDKNGVLHAIGTKADPAYLSEGTADTGTAATDGRTISFTIKATTASPAIYTGTINVTPI